MSASFPTEAPAERLALVAALAEPAGRDQSARRLAVDLGADDLVLFVRDPEIGVLLPVAGLPQTWPRPWRTFVAEAVGRPSHSGRLPAPDGAHEIDACAVATSDGAAVLVLTGGQPKPAAVASIALVLPLLARLFADERGIAIARAQATLARQAAAEARSLADALDVSRRALQQEVRTREGFLAAASHDLKNPLGVIKGVAQLLRRRQRRADLTPERLVRGLESIETAVDQMATLVDELLDVARLQMGQPLELHRVSMDLVELLQQAIVDYQRGTDRHRLRLVATEASLVGNWDRARLARVIGNLIGNAVKYSPSGGEVLITVAREERDGRPWAVVEVRDQGIGIPAGDVPLVFERFHRAANTVGRISGAGVGLAASRQLVEQHAGTIVVDSQEGIGSTFVVYLPLHEPTPDTA